MCIGCWHEYGAPTLDTPAIRALGVRLRDADNFGPLHIVVDDWNLGRDHIRFCRREALKQGDLEAAQLARDLERLPMPVKASAMAWACGFISNHRSCHTMPGLNEQSGFAANLSDKVIAAAWGSLPSPVDIDYQDDAAMRAFAASVILAYLESEEGAASTLATQPQQ